MYGIDADSKAGKNTLREATGLTDVGTDFLLEYLSATFTFKTILGLLKGNLIDIGKIYYRYINTSVYTSPQCNRLPAAGDWRSLYMSIV